MPPEVNTGENMFAAQGPGRNFKPWGTDKSLYPWVISKSVTKHGHTTLFDHCPISQPNPATSAPNTSAIYPIPLDPSDPFSISSPENKSNFREMAVDSTTITYLHLSIWSFLLSCGVIPRLRTIYLHPLQLRRSSPHPMTVLPDDCH